MKYLAFAFAKFPEINPAKNTFLNNFWEIKIAILELYTFWNKWTDLKSKIKHSL